MLRYLYAACFASASAGCVDTAPDGNGLVIELLADQPHAPINGVSLAVHARGGAGLQLTVQQGLYRAELGDNGALTEQTTGCAGSSSSQQPFGLVVSVYPTSEETLLFATLYVEGNCTGEVVQSRLVSIRPAAITPMPASGVAP